MVVVLAFIDRDNSEVVLAKIDREITVMIVVLAI